MYKSLIKKKNNDTSSTSLRTCTHVLSAEENTNEHDHYDLQAKLIRTSLIYSCSAAVSCRDNAHIKLEYLLCNRI